MAGDRPPAIESPRCTPRLQLPGEEDLGVSDGIVVANGDGSGSPALRLPAGTAIRGWANWSPDHPRSSLRGATRHHAMEDGQPPTGDNHEHIYVVPVDGSPVREMLDDTMAGCGRPRGPPTDRRSSTIRRECPLD